MTLWLAVCFAFGFALTNGFHDAANAIATLVATRGARPGQAIVLSAIFNLLGAVLVGTAVADTIAGIVTVAGPDAVRIIGAGVLGAALWNVLTWWRGLPSSSGHALVGGLVGAALAAPGTGAVRWGGLEGWQPVGVIGEIPARRHALSPRAGARQSGRVRSLGRARDLAVDHCTTMRVWCRRSGQVQQVVHVAHARNAPHGALELLDQARILELAAEEDGAALCIDADASFGHVRVAEDDALDLVRERGVVEVRRRRMPEPMHDAMRPATRDCCPHAGPADKPSPGVSKCRGTAITQRMATRATAIGIEAVDGGRAAQRSEERRARVRVAVALRDLPPSPSCNVV